jgi:hypothetical protein
MSKTLNNQQRKVLSKLYERQFSAKEQEIRVKRNDEFKELLDNLNSTIKDKDFTNYIKATETVKRLEKVLKERYERGDIEFSTASYNSAPRLSYKTSSYNGTVNPKLQKHNEKTKQVVEQVEIAAQDAQTRIYGLDVTFEEIKKEIDNLLRGL